MKVVRPDCGVEPERPCQSVFLAGPIQGAPEWDAGLCAELSGCDAVAFDPRRLSFEGFSYDEQVRWETEHLRIADVVSFTFAHEAEHVEGRSYAQTSRFELGEAMARAKHSGNPQKIVVFCPEDFSGYRYFKHKVEEEYPDVAVLCSEWNKYVEVLRGLLS